jgi:hypothetical protein
MDSRVAIPSVQCRIPNIKVLHMTPRLTISLLLLAGTISGCSQDTSLTQEFKSSTIARVVTLINANYVFENVGEKTGEHLQAKMKAGAFDDIKDIPSFARALTQEVQSINHDKHMRIRPNPGGDGGRRKSDDGGGGFYESKMLDNNIGYVDMRGFMRASIASKYADEHMKKLSNADAIIIDMRKNGGGSPDMVQYFCSYFFDKRVHLNSLYWRKAKRTDEFWTIDVEGKKLPDVPLFVLTSSYTFSGGEEFCYNMQTQKRATLIGETTGGGANPGEMFTVNDQLVIFIPTGRAINPITKTNWEGTGVVPEVKVPADEALTKAIELAKSAAEKRRGK